MYKGLCMPILKSGLWSKDGSGEKKLGGLLETWRWSIWFNFASSKHWGIIVQHLANFMQISWKKLAFESWLFFLESRAARVILSDPTGQYFFEVFFLSVEMRIKKTWVFSNFWDSYTPKCSHIFLKHLQVDRIQYIPAGYAMQKPSYTSGQVRRFFPIMTGGGPHYPRWELGFPGLKTACLSPPLEGIAVQTYSHHWGTSWFQVGNRQCKLFC